MLPILIATWNLGRAWGFLVAGLAAVAMQLAHVRSVETNVLVPSWNALVWYAVFLFVVWLLAIIRDHAKRQRSQLESQEEVSDDLRAQNDMKNTLLHAVSHDLKGPLAGILGAMQTIRRAAHFFERRQVREARRTALQPIRLVGAIRDQVDAELALGRFHRGIGLAFRHRITFGEQLEVMDQRFHVALHLFALGGRTLRSSIITGPGFAAASRHIA